MQARLRSVDRRTLQILTLTAVLVAVFALLFLDTVNRPEATTSVWMMARSVSGGATIDATALRAARVPSAAAAGGYLSSAPIGKIATHSLGEGDILRMDDVTADPVVTVPVRLTGYQPSAGETIDIYLVSDGRVSLVGRGIPYLGGSGMEVPATDEQLWVAMFGSSTTLIAARSSGAGVDGSDPVSAGDAARQLEAIAARPK